MESLKQLKQDIVNACRIVSQQKLVEGFGHVSARIAGADSFLITPRIGLAQVEEEDLLTMDLACTVIDGAQPAPFEAWLHAAIMKAKPWVNAITRIHARWRIFSRCPIENSSRSTIMAAFLPEACRFFRPDLISTETLGAEVADAWATDQRYSCVAMARSPLVEPFRKR